MTENPGNYTKDKYKKTSKVAEESKPTIFMPQYPRNNRPVNPLGFLFVFYISCWELEKPTTQKHQQVQTGKTKNKKKLQEEESKGM